MSSRWGGFVYRHRRAVVIVTVLVAVASFVFAGRASERLSSGGWVVEGSPSAAVEERLASEFGEGRSSLLVLFRTAGGSVTSPEVEAAIAAALADLRDDPRVEGVVGHAETGDARFVSRAGDATYVVVQLASTDEEAIDEVEELRALLRPQPGLTTQLTGYGPLALDANEQSEVDLQRAETVSLPAALLILLAVFASVIAAGMPLLVAGLAIPSTMALIFAVSQATEMSIYVLNVATMLGLALAIDYSLFIVSRFREELGRGRSVELAVRRTVATSGKAVIFSGLAVAIGLLGLLWFTTPAIGSIGIGGALVVICSVFYALTFLPAVLGMLGPRVDRLSLRSLVARLRGRRAPGAAAPAGPGRGTWWERVAHGVMRRPVLVLVPTLAVLLISGTPFLRIQQAVPGPEVFPAGLESRDAYVAITEEFPPGEISPYVILAEVEGEPTAPDNAAALARYAERLVAVEGIDRVESPFSLTDPRTGSPMTPATIRTLYALPAAQRPPELQAFLDATVRGSTVRLDAVSPLRSSSPAATDLVAQLRALDPGEGISAEIGGVAASGYDTLASLRERTPWAVATTLVAMAIVLFLLFGSVVLPIKAIFMTLLSITASFGALVWIFQEGNLAGLLDFEPLGYTIAGNAIIMFSVLFGLSMDYEVLLLSRIQESYRRTGDNSAAVAEGLAHTAAVITGAALIMVTVFAAFVLAEIVTIKSIGVGMAIAVFLDATIIRVLLVPATMRLMGRWNWWAPGPLGRLADRLGFGHAEGDEDHARPETRDSAPRAAPAG